MSTLKYIELQQHMLLWFGNHTLSLPHIVAVTPHFFPIYFRRRHHSSNAYARTGSLFLRQNINYQKRLTSDIWSDITKGNFLPYECVRRNKKKFILRVLTQTLTMEKHLSFIINRHKTHPFMHCMTGNVNHRK